MQAAFSALLALSAFCAGEFENAESAKDAINAVRAKQMGIPT